MQAKILVVYDDKWQGKLKQNKKAHDERNAKWESNPNKTNVYTESYEEQ